MEKKQLFGVLALVSFIAIFFMPPDSKAWIYFLVLGVIFGIGWFKS
ncbi:hypothetical protein J4422_01015 [Candidatus Pacearchaeota archaeon]|nr:hypothetical protein [Candidatus Pacearchaeota archaeon]